MTTPVPAGADESNPGRHLRAGARAGILATLLSQGLSTVATLLLARLLSPADFGSVAAAQSIVGLFALAASVGPANSLVLRPSADRALASSMFWHTAVLGLVIAVSLYVTADLFASAIGNDDAAQLIRVMALGVPFQMCAGIPRGLLLRRFRYAPIYRTDILAVVCYVVVQVSLAALGAGALSVAIGQTVMSVATLVLMSWSAGFRPAAHMRWNHIREDIPIMSGLGAYQTASYVGKNVDYWIVSWALGPRALGLYYIAFVLPNILRLRVSSLISEVFLPLLAQIRDETSKRSQLVLQSYRMAAVLIFPVMAGIASLAEPVLRLCFGSQWTASAPALRWLCLAAAVEVLIPVSTTATIAAGRPLGSAVLQACRAGVLAGILVALHVTGELTLATAGAAVCCSTLVAFLLSLRLVHVQIGAAVRAVGTAAVSSATLYLVVGLVLGQAPSHTIVQLLVGIPTGILTYGVAGLCLGRSRFRTDVMEVVHVIPFIGVRLSKKRVPRS